MPRRTGPWGGGGRRRAALLLDGLLALLGSGRPGAAAEPAHGQVRDLRITILSTMLADAHELGEWGFSALVEVDGRRILFDTGAHDDVVLRNARSLQVDLLSVPEVVLSHNHADHTGGLLALRRAVAGRAPGALAVAHVATGILYPRLGVIPGIEGNTMIATARDYEAAGGRFVVHDGPQEIHPGVWLTGPVPRKYDERNWSPGDRVRLPSGAVVEDTIPEDMSLVFDTPRGLVILTGCGHAGIVNIVTFARAVVRPARIHAIIGGIHLFDASDETVRWTARKLGETGLDDFIGAHCTGIETVYAFRRYLNLDRAHAVVGAVGARFDLGTGIDPGYIAR